MEPNAEPLTHACKRQDGLTWGEFSKAEAERMAKLYRDTGASDIAVEIQSNWIRSVRDGRVYWDRPETY